MDSISRNTMNDENEACPILNARRDSFPHSFRLPLKQLVRDVQTATAHETEEDLLKFRDQAQILFWKLLPGEATVQIGSVASHLRIGAKRVAYKALAIPT